MSETETSQEGMPFVLVEQAGYYLLAEDVSAWLAGYASSFRGEGRAALLAAAAAFAATESPAEEPLETSPVEPSAHVVNSSAMTVTATRSTVARVEVYPNELGNYWYARPIDAEGKIVGEEIGQISHDGLLAEIERLWPGVPVFELPDALTDSVWQEENHASTFNGRQRPSTRRLFGR